jgi:hypothetical protein
MLGEGGNYNFNKDIVLGEEGEQIIRTYLEGLNFKFISDNKDYRYDLLMEYKNKQYTYEVKTDIYPRDTGNIAIEIECRGKPSGVMVTEADFYVTYFKHFDEIWNISTNRLRDLIRNGKFKVITGGDSGSNTKMVLMNRALVRPYFKVHKIDRTKLNVK